jgi:hypothetical protein
VLTRRRISLVCFCLHFFLLLTVSLDALFGVLSRGYTMLPHWLDKYWGRAQSVTNAILGGTLSVRNPARQALHTYLNAAGIEGGYGFFAPNVPNSYKLVFELHYPDGRVEYELPIIGGAAAGVRMGNLLDQIGGTQYEPLRAMMVKMLAYSVWQKHPDATAIRAVFGYIELPGSAEAAEGKTESYRFLRAYDLKFHPPMSKPEQQ